MRGDPALGVAEWGLREELFHHLAEIDRLMLERYGQDRMPRTVDGRLFLLSEFFFNTKSEVGDAVTDELVSGFDLDGHIGGAIHHIEAVDDRWCDGRPERRVMVLDSTPRPTAARPLGAEPASDRSARASLSLQRGRIGHAAAAAALA